LERRPGFWQAVALTLLGHGAVFGWLASVQPDPVAFGGVQAAPMHFQVRPLQPSVRAPGDQAPPTPAPGAETPATLQAAPAAAPGPAPQPVIAAAPPAAPAPPPADAPYLPRGQLTVPPRLLGHVDVPFPPDVQGIVDLKVRITLFIDERGAVQRLRLDTPDVHPAFERSIRDAFGSARFSPGEIEQSAVRSQIRLEVEFQAPQGGRRS
jgi:hypothetical protein